MANEQIVADGRTRDVPLRLCEVLEREYAAIQGESVAEPDWLLAREHIDAARVVDLLSTPSQAALPQAIDTIRRKLELRQLVLPPDNRIDEPFAQQLREKLNALLDSREMLFDYHLVERDTNLWQLADLFRHSATSRGNRSDSATAAVASGKPEAARSAAEHTLLNRLLLEAAFPPSAIARVDAVRQHRLFTEIHRMRGPENIYSALCLSGGGIRSASFALGVLQGLARCGILDKFDFLSTVSGGGYIGSWLSTWIHRHPGGLAGVTTELANHAQRDVGNVSRTLQPESGQIRFLRSYSHFLNPKAGLFSADTWSWIGLYLRNLSLNWLTLIPLLLLAIALPRLYASVLYSFEFAHVDMFPLLMWIATLAAVATLVCATVNRPSISDPVRFAGSAKASERERFMEPFKRQGWVLALGVVPFTLFAILLTLFVWGFRGSASLDGAQTLRWIETTPWFQLPLVLAYVGVQNPVIWGELIVFASWLVSISLLPGRDWGKRLLELGAMLLAGALTWTLVAVLSDYAIAMSRSGDAALKLDGVDIYPAHLYAVFAVPVVILTVLAGMTVFIGIVSKGRWIEDEDREWWARFGAWMLIVTVAWCAWAGIALFGPTLLLESPKLVAGVGGISGLIAVLIGKSSLTTASGQPGPGNESRKRSVLSIVGINWLAGAALLFFAVFIAALSLLSSAGLDTLVTRLHVWLAPNDALPQSFIDLLRPPREFTASCGFGDAWTAWTMASVFKDANVHLQVVCQTPLSIIWAVIIGLALLLGASSLLINLNKFSLHAAYRIRIVRTFLGASRRSERRPNPFTGFDPLDNVQMHELQPGLLRDADIVNLPHFVMTLRQELIGPSMHPPVRLLVGQMCAPRHDPGGVLEDRLRHAEPDKPVLKALERSLLEALNRVLETTPLEETDEFRALIASDERAKQIRQYARDGHQIFANRLLLQAAFPDDINAYKFQPPPHKLMHVINLTLNLVHGRRLAWQERKAAPFAVTPICSGSYYLGYRESREFGGSDGISIGTAAAVSGAAVSPNMGYSSSPVTALLLTLFNVRLGWWLGNPGIAGTRTFRRAEPKFSLGPVIAEALGLTDDRSPYVYLSDGGHFENMALFEMVLRRCRLIVASDAGADPEYQFEDLGNAVRKIRIDLGIPIEFSTMPIHKRTAKVDDTVRYCALGRIRYSEVDGASASDGVLVLIKPVVSGREPQDVLNYAAQKERFPQEPTADQFFGESQFESYRQLGEFETQTVCGGPIDSSGGKSWAAQLVKAARAYLGCEQEEWIDRWLKTVSGVGEAKPPSIEQAAADD